MVAQRQPPGNGNTESTPHVVPLILGGHSFITQLGSDPAADGDMQARIVATCLDRGIRWFDTTYQPERVALGRVLTQLGRRDQARIIAWNFFQPFGPEDQVGGPAAYQPQHLPRMLDELRVDRIDALVVHAVGDAREDARQLDLARQWQADGCVGELGTWVPGRDALDVYANDNPFGFMVHPRNVDTRWADPVFEAARALGWRTCACSPFVRGWRLNELAQRAASLDPALTDAQRVRRVADMLLRDALFHPAVDQLIVCMRTLPWIDANMASVVRGPLDDQERAWLDRLLRLPAT